MKFSAAFSDVGVAWLEKRFLPAFEKLSGGRALEIAILLTPHSVHLVHDARAGGGPEVHADFAVRARGGVGGRAAARVAARARGVGAARASALTRARATLPRAARAAAPRQVSELFDPDTYKLQSAHGNKARARAAPPASAPRNPSLTHSWPRAPRPRPPQIAFYVDAVVLRRVLAGLAASDALRCAPPPATRRGSSPSHAHPPSASRAVPTRSAAPASTSSSPSAPWRRCPRPRRPRTAPRRRPRQLRSWSSPPPAKASTSARACRWQASRCGAARWMRWSGWWAAARSACRTGWRYRRAWRSSCALSWRRSRRCAPRWTWQPRRCAAARRGLRHAARGAAAALTGALLAVRMARLTHSAQAGDLHLYAATHALTLGTEHRGLKARARARGCIGSASAEPQGCCAPTRLRHGSGRRRRRPAAPPRPAAAWPPRARATAPQKSTWRVIIARPLPTGSPFELHPSHCGTPPAPLLQAARDLLLALSFHTTRADCVLLGVGAGRGCVEVAMRFDDTGAARDAVALGIRLPVTEPEGLA
jgi:hypothetical protein